MVQSLQIEIQTGVSIRTRQRCRVNAGRAPGVPLWAVSIRTRQRCRVNVLSNVSQGLRSGFNPHPAALPGEWKH